ncbi:MAG: dihydropteroate synthase [Anaerolineae bacterium]|nr:dihydropteroate synthase [Anaerolineae bacterium]MDW8099540.1 dihydropteroate synthase [Anaerolineae bacterium]
MHTTISSATRTVVIGHDKPFVIIGERINPTGRKQLLAEMQAGNFSRVREDAIAQAQAGAHILDVNAGVPGADEAALLCQAVREVMAVTDLPLCFDSANPAALEAALALYTGKPLINSVTGEESSMERVLPLVKRYNAAVIAMCNDEGGIRMDARERLAVARKILRRAEEYGIPPEDVIIDCQAMAVSADHRAGRVTLETIRLVTQELGNNTTIGASNISFGLPDRTSLNAAFLSMAIACGLTCAITNPLVPENRKAIRAADLFMGRDEFAMNWITAFRAEQAR